MVMNIQNIAYKNKIRYYITSTLLNETLATLRKRGCRQQESIVLWAGKLNEDSKEAHILTSIVPKKGHWGGGVTLKYSFLLKLNDELHKRELLLLSQVHTHPGDFGHSLGDELNAVSYRLGYISIVVPNFANYSVSFYDSYFYEYIGNWKWCLLTKDEVATRFTVVDSKIRI